MITSAKQPWLIMAIQNGAKEVIRTAEGSGNPDAMFSAKKPAENLISCRHFEFREVL